MNFFAPIILILTVFLSGCTGFNPAYNRPAFDMPQKWKAEEVTPTGNNMIYRDWWKTFQDPTLEKLILEALTNNDDLTVASAKLRQAKAQYDYAFGNRFPLLSVMGYGSHSAMDFKNSDLLSDKPATMGVLGGLLSYEVDLVGKFSSKSSEARAGYLAADYNQYAVRLSVVAATAQLYFSLLALDADSEVMKNLLRVQEKTYQLVQKQVEAEAVNTMVLHAAEAGLAEVKTRLSEMADEREKAETALVSLLGRSPREIVEGKIERGKRLNSLSVPLAAPDSLPSELLERRPDIAASEQVLIATHFNIAYARAAYFPAISLSGLLGVARIDLDNLYNGTVRTWDLGGSLAGPLIDFGRTRSGVDLALAENQEKLALYKKSVRTAFMEVREALSALNHSRNIEEEQVRKESALKEVLRLEELRLKEGYSTYLDVLSVERSLCEAQITCVSAKLGRLNASVGLYKALGGGWTLKIEEKPGRIKGKSEIENRVN